MNALAKGLPVVAVALAAAWVIVGAIPPRDPEGAMKLHEFAMLPVAHEGRVKPIDTVARTSLRVLSGRQTFRDASGDERPAAQWLLDVMADADGLQRIVFRIDHPEVVELMGLRPVEGYRYALSAFRERLPDLAREATDAEARKKRGEKLDAFESKVLALAEHVNLYVQLAEQTSVHAVPSGPAEAPWMTLPEAVDRAETRGRRDPDAESWIALLAAYHSGDAPAFNAAVAEEHARLRAARPADMRKAEFESFFNHAEPFYRAAVLYVAAFVLGALAWMGWAQMLNRTASALIIFTLILHTTALVSRIYISGRPPVTNLYSSAVFVGWGAVVIGVILEGAWRLGIGNLIASVAGFTTLVIAHLLAADGDTFHALQAVLDTQFWLATHVTCVTLGYAATFVAGLLGVLFILRGALTGGLTPALADAMTRMTYGTLCFALFFSFVGTVLGGLWADDSWGRFWGWDPKENGALIIVLWNALILHARWGGLVRRRGLAVLAVFGNVVTAWSWFGVNQLGVGLHSYGWTQGAAQALGAFVLAQLAIVVLGLVPARRWRSAPALTVNADPGSRTT